MIREFSAGGIVYKVTPSTDSGNTISILLCQHSQHHGWVFPKGFIGDKIAGESKEDTALREVQEETGIIGELVEPVQPITYWFEMDGKKHKKTVYYYIMKHLGGNTANHDWEMENVEWLPIESVDERLTYDSDKTVWKKTRGKIEQLATGN